MEANFNFFIYAFPALGGCCGMGDERQSSYLEKILKREAPSEKEIEKMLPAAALRMEKKYGKNFWSVENVRDYWWVEHNRIIDAGEMEYEDATPEQRENCKTKFWKVKSIGDDGLVSLKGKNGEEINGYNYRKLGLKEGEYVVTHKKFIIEDVSLKDYEKYG